MPCCLSCFEEDRDALDIKYQILNAKYDKILVKLNELSVFVEEIRHNNRILIREYGRLKEEYELLNKK